MILFIFEGDVREPRLYRTLERLYFPKVNDKSFVLSGITYMTFTMS